MCEDCYRDEHEFCRQQEAESVKRISDEYQEIISSLVSKVADLNFRVRNLERSHEDAVALRERLERRNRELEAKLSDKVK